MCESIFMLSFFTSWGLESLRNRCPLWGLRDVATHNSDINSTQPKFGNGLAPIALIFAWKYFCSKDCHLRAKQGIWIYVCMQLQML